ncbi:hypothetical protein DFQ27_005016 [Actinomortierella ambigua]|uniref:Mitochondrial carrier n=1 Tax=Actinomortierella ambigua TaxID=1343610 RepID=A0A9P6PZZ5_9FUNG|nr:hypothetical protein DFQ27_005016 [Actinomortierella ambigua]
MTYELPPIGHALSGGVAAALSNVVIYPLDLATTRVQSQSTNAASATKGSSTHSHHIHHHHQRQDDDDPKSLKPIEFKRITDPSEAPRIFKQPPPSSSSSSSGHHYKNELDALRKVYATEGFRALYSGLSADTAATLLSNFVYFYIYTWLRQYKEHRRKSGQLSIVQELFLGAEAGVLSRLFTNPIHVITTRLQVAGKGGAMAGTKKSQRDAGTGTGTGTGTEASAGAPEGLRLSPSASGRNTITGSASGRASARSIIRDIYREHGPLGFWSGYAPTVILSINPSITYFLFETMKKWLVARQTQRLLKQHRLAGTEATKAALAAAATLSSLQIFFASAFSKAMASLVTYPLILSKTKLQAKKEDEDEDEDEEQGEGDKGDKEEDKEIGGGASSLASLSTSSLPAATTIAIERSASSSSVSSSVSSATLATSTVRSTSTTNTTSNTTMTTTTTTTKKKKESFDGISDVFRTVIRDQGLRGLYVGCQGQVIKGFFSFGLMYMIKDRVVAWMLALFLTMHNMRKRVGN